MRFWTDRFRPSNLPWRLLGTECSCKYVDGLKYFFLKIILNSFRGINQETLFLFFLFDAYY